MAARLPGSFRDPAGHVFVSDDIVYRRIEPAGREPYEHLMRSGLYQALTRQGLLVAHDDLGPQPTQPGAWTVIRPERVPMISYPYEWCFSQLRDAALLLLRVQQRALAFGLSLKDASAYNVQFLRGRPVLIDTLSFEPSRPGPWLAYRQFCQHFYAPLLLMRVDPRLARLSQVFIDGVPLPLASRLLPRSTWLRPAPLMHLHLHAKAEEKWSRPSCHPDGAHAAAPAHEPSATRDMRPLLDSLVRAVDGLHWQPRSAWASYYTEQPSYEQAAFDRKRAVVESWLQGARPSTVWDLGANTGQFAKLAAAQGATTVALDGDPACVELLYREGKAVDDERVLPLVADLAHPSPAVGWGNAERMTLEERGPADMLLALALVHHLAIGNNVPLAAIAAYFSRLGRRAIVEFVPPSDAMVAHMMRGRHDAFAGYDGVHFERALAGCFTIDERTALTPSDRVLYLLTAR